VFTNKIVNGIKEVANLLSPVRDTCEFYCGAEPYAIVNVDGGDTKICKTCLGRLSNMFKPSDIKLIIQ
jgi:hypothetical protein